MTRSLQPLERSFPEGRHAPAARRLVEFPLLGRGQDDLRRRRPRARASRDIDGNEYIDYRMAYGPCILGYADPRVDAAARAGIEVGGVFALVDRTRIRGRRAHREDGAGRRARALFEFRHRGRDGGAARSRAPTPARTRTSSSRAAITACSTPRSGTRRSRTGSPRPATRTSCRTARGVPGILRGLLHAVPMNDADRLESVFKAYGHEIAAFLIEPIMGNCCSISATREYLRDARALCDRYGILMIIDEVKTGLPRGARRRAGAVRRARPTSAPSPRRWATATRSRVVAGREDIMRKLGHGVVHGGTFTCHSVALAAAEKTLRDPRRDAGAADDRGVRHAAAHRHEPDPLAARHHAIRSAATLR